MEVTEGESDQAALQNLTPEQQERMRTAVRLMISYLLDRVSLKCQNETKKDVTGVQATEPRAEQLRLDI
jgi:hypothetical protein